MNASSEAEAPGDGAADESAAQRAPWRPLWRSLLLPLLAAACVRAAVAIAFSGTDPAGDERAYLLLGERWRLEGTYEGIWAPGYPALIAGLGGLAGDASTAVLRGLQVLLGVWNVAWIGALAAVIGGRRGGVCAAWIAALYLPLAGFAGLLYSEPLHLALFTPALALLAAASRLPSAATLRVAAGAGVLLGLAALVRESSLLFVPALGLWLAWNGAAGGAPRASLALTMVACALATILPWTLRNAAVHGQLVPIAISTGGSAHIGLNAHDVNYDLAGLGGDPAQAPGALRAAIRGPAPEPWSAADEGAPAARARANVAQGLRYAALHPLFFLRSRVVELVDLMSPLSFPVRSLRLASPGPPLGGPAARLAFAACAVLMVPGLLLLALHGWWAMRTSPAHRALLLCVVGVVVLSALVNGMSRYRLPALPLLIGFAALALVGTRTDDGGARRRAALLVAAGLLLLWVPSIEGVQQTLSLLR